MAEWVESGATLTTDDKVLVWFRENLPQDRPDRPSKFASSVRDVTALGSGTVLIFLTVSVAGYFALQGRWRTALQLLVTTSLGWFLMDTLKEHYGRTRPTVVEHRMSETSLSFPSGHAKMSAVVYLTLAALLAQRSPRRRVKVFWLSLAIVLTLLIGCSRLYLGVHYPSDVLAGWVAGAAWALFALLLARLWDYYRLRRLAKGKEAQSAERGRE
jgi:undecaprenyl-diphosphatase